MSNIDLDTARELKYTSIKKYQRQIGHIKMKLNWLYDGISALAIFVRHSCREYNNKEVTENIKFG